MLHLGRDYVEKPRQDKLLQVATVEKGSVLSPYGVTRDDGVEKSKLVYIKSAAFQVSIIFFKKCSVMRHIRRHILSEIPPDIVPRTFLRGLQYTNSFKVWFIFNDVGEKDSYYNFLKLYITKEQGKAEK